MSWQPILLVACSVAVAYIGALTYLRSRRSDKVLNVAANIQATYEAQRAVTDGLRADVTRLREANERCDEATNHLRRSLSNAHLVVDAQSREMAQLKATVAEHELTISRHERTINELRAKQNSG